MRMEHGLKHTATVADLTDNTSKTKKETKPLTVQNVDQKISHTVKKKKPSRNRMVAEHIARKYNGKVIGAIAGNKGRAGYIVEVDDRRIHIYLINVWHRNRKSISINTQQLQKAVDDDALILMSYKGKEFVLHSTIWELWAKQDNSYDIHTKYGTTEVFCKTDYLRILDLDKIKLERYYPD